MLLHEHPYPHGRTQNIFHIFFWQFSGRNTTNRLENTMSWFGRGRMFRNFLKSFLKVRFGYTYIESEFLGVPKLSIDYTVLDRRAP